MKFIVSVGHGEFVPHGDGVTVDCVWDPWGEDFPDGAPEVVAPELWKEITGLDEMPDADFGWETILSVEGEREALNAALDTMIVELGEDPGADDGTFDYWPSGMRLAFAIDVELGGEHKDAIEAVAREIIGRGFRIEFADELFGKIGMETPEDFIVPGAAVYVVVTLHEGAITDLEILDAPPLWNLEELGQVCYMGAVNGGDSRRFPPPAGLPLLNRIKG